MTPNEHVAFALSRPYDRTADRFAAAIDKRGTSYETT